MVSLLRKEFSKFLERNEPSPHFLHKLSNRILAFVPQRGPVQVKYLDGRCASVGEPLYFSIVHEIQMVGWIIQTGVEQ
ncbi:hypothetical protein D3C85_1481060 [compost metagenome]